MGGMESFIHSSRHLSLDGRFHQQPSSQRQSIALHTRLVFVFRGGAAAAPPNDSTAVLLESENIPFFRLLRLDDGG